MGGSQAVKFLRLADSQVPLRRVRIPNPRAGPVAMLLGGVILTGCARDVSTQGTAAGRDASPGPHLQTVATIQDLMEQQIDPSADALWDSVAYIASTTGIEDRKPHTDEQWQAVRTSALTLIEAANLISMPGRRIASPLKSAGRGELEPAQIQQRIAASPEAFTQLARGLQNAALRALDAIDARDPQRLMDAGGAIDEACEACHVTYWYPDQQRPGN